MKTISDGSLEEIKQGYTSSDGRYYCSYCDACYEEGELYAMENHFYLAPKAIKKHLHMQHDSVFHQLLTNDKKTTSLTDIQNHLLSLIEEGKTDKEIAQLCDISPSTVRHQRFVFKEKAKQAKMYLAIYELAMEGKQDDFLSVHTGANMVDERFIATTKEEQQVFDTMFTSLNPLVLKQIPAKEKKKIIVLRKITSQLDENKHYEEKELNAFLKTIHADFATLRRYLIEYGFLNRTSDCKEYWVKS